MIGFSASPYYMTSGWHSPSPVQYLAIVYIQVREAFQQCCLSVWREQSVTHTRLSCPTLNRSFPG